MLGGGDVRAGVVVVVGEGLGMVWIGGGFVVDGLVIDRSFV